MVMETRLSIELPCFQLKQPMGEFFVCKISAKDLCKITYFDIRKMLGENEIDEYIGMQRKVDKNRVKDLQQYVNTLDACFPSSIVLAVDARSAEYDERKHVLRLTNDPMPEDNRDKPILFHDIARVIDGQHRIEGLKGLTDNATFEVTVSIFVGLDIEDQAYIFSTVNLAQTKVNKSLVYDLYDFARFRSPQRTCHNIVIAFDRRAGSPFEHRIKRLGSATEGRGRETLTQATFVEALMPYISSNPSVDRDLLRRGKALPKPDQETLKRVIFRNLFIEEKDTDIALIIYNYFLAIRRRWPEAWNSLEPGSMLSRTNGFKAFMRFLRPLYRTLDPKQGVPTEAAFARWLEKIELNDDEFNTTRFVPGTSGESELLNTLVDQAGLRHLLR